MTPTEFLLARIAEDEAAARGHLGDPRWRTERRIPVQPSFVKRWQIVSVSEDVDAPGYPAERIAELMIGGGAEEERSTALHIARHDPTRVLRECEAKRRIVENAPFTWDDGSNRSAGIEHWRLTCRILAAVYADHPDYDEAWRA